MKLVRDKVQKLKPYEPKDLPYKIKLDANEGKNILFKDMYEEILKGLSDINLYPDDSSRILKKSIKNYMGADEDSLVVGNGSSEMIELLMKSYIDDNDKVVSLVPSFSMYQVFTEIYGGEFVGVKTDSKFNILWDELIKTCQTQKPKLVFLCNPNNPTGNLLDKDQIIEFVKSVDSIVVVDEAYMEFTEGSLWEQTSNYSNLVVIKTLSKALGLAGIRVGYMIAPEEILKDIKKVKSPYNLNSLSQYVATKSLEQKDKIKTYVDLVKSQREYLYKELLEIEDEVFESFANFILFKSSEEDLFQKLADKKILIRTFSGDLEGYYRVTIGSSEENQEFIRVLKEIKGI